MTRTGTYTPAAGYHFLTPFYDAGVRLTTRETVWREALVEFLAPKDHDLVLDIGAGTGNLALLVASKNPSTRYFGIDPDQHALEIAREKARRAGIVAEFRQSFFSTEAVADWPPPSLATLCLVLHQVPLDEKLRLLREIHSVLQPGGRLLIADYGEQRSWLMRRLFRATIQQLDGIADTQPNADGVLMPLMREAGFSNVRELKQVKTVTGSISILSGVKADQG
ncbi:MAG: class I SAM-dependent methyltransferase [Sphingomonadaceae bacterium]|nr:class I SAM-dependent methyltransferase [Sphingomonadaceae bacterium]